MSDIQEIMRNARFLIDEMSAYVNIPLLITEIILGSIISLISGPLMLYASIALGHLFRKHRVLWAIISYFVIYVAMQIIASILLGIFGYSSPADYARYTAKIMENYLIFSTVFSAACTAGFYAITNYIFSKKLNLE